MEFREISLSDLEPRNFVRRFYEKRPEKDSLTFFRILDEGKGKGILILEKEKYPTDPSVTVRLVSGVSASEMGNILTEYFMAHYPTLEEGERHQVDIWWLGKGTTDDLLSNLGQLGFKIIVWVTTDYDGINGSVGLTLERKLTTPEPRVSFWKRLKGSVFGTVSFFYDMWLDSRGESY